MILLPQYTESTELWYKIYQGAINISRRLDIPLTLHPKDYQKMMEAKRIKENIQPLNYI